MNTGAHYSRTRAMLCPCHAYVHMQQATYGRTAPLQVATDILVVAN
jgi:hypothetical protein